MCSLVLVYSQIGFSFTSWSTCSIRAWREIFICLEIDVTISRPQHILSTVRWCVQSQSIVTEVMHFNQILSLRWGFSFTLRFRQRDRHYSFCYDKHQQQCLRKKLESVYYNNRASSDLPPNDSELRLDGAWADLASLMVHEGALLPTLLCSLKRYYPNITII